MSVYGKTGTTNNDYDKWFVGYTPYYVGAVWFGFDQQKSIRSAGITSNISAKLWKMTMEKVHEGLSPAQIEMPDDLVRAYVCNISGLLATENCAGSSEYFLSGTQPKKYCSEDHLKKEEELETEEGPQEETPQEIPEGTTEVPPEETPPTQEPPAQIDPIVPETSRPQIGENDVISLE